MVLFSIMVGCYCLLVRRNILQILIILEVFSVGSVCVAIFFGVVGMFQILICVAVLTAVIGLSA